MGGLGTKTMRIGMIRNKYDASGGAERTLLLLAQGLLARNHETHVIASAWHGERPPGLFVHLTAGLPRFPKWSRPRRFWEAAQREMQHVSAEVWLSLERTPGIPVLRAGDGCHAAWLRRRGRYVSLAKRLSFALNPLHRTILQLERQALGHPDLRQVICGSRMVATEFQEYYQTPESKLLVIHNGVDPVRLAPARRPEVRAETRRSLGLEPYHQVMLFLGSGWGRKGLGFALDALAHLPRVHLLVAGKDAPRPYEARAQRLGVAERVHFLGLRPDAPRLMAAADLLVLPTIYDPCANACLEALEAGLPVVTTQANGASDLVEEGLSGGVVADPADIPALAEACRQALTLPRGFVSRVPSMGSWLDQIIGLLEESAPARAGQS